MPIKRQKRLAQQVSDADFVLKKITGKGIADYAKMLWQLWGREVAKDVMLNQDIDEADRNDCRFLGADSFYSYKVFKFAARVFREEHHPDRFLNPDDKVREENIFKMGEQTIARICERRGWKVP